MVELKLLLKEHAKVVSFFKMNLRRKFGTR